MVESAKPENPYRSYVPFLDFMTRMYGSQETEKPEKTEGEESTPKTLFADDAIRAVSLAAIAKAGNFSYACALEMRMIRDNTISSDSNFLLKGAAYVTYIATAPIFMVAVAVEAVVRKAMSYIVNCFVMCRPPEMSTGSEKADEAEEVKKTTLAPAKEEEEKEPTPTLYERHVEWSGDVMKYQVGLAASLSFGLLALQDIFDATVASFNPFHDTFSLRPSMGVTAPIYAPLLGTTIEGILPVLALTEKMFSEFTQNGEDQDLRGETIPVAGKRLPAGLNFVVNPLAAVAFKMLPLELGTTAYEKLCVEGADSERERRANEAMLKMARQAMTSGMSNRDYQAARSKSMNEHNSLDRTYRYLNQRLFEKKTRSQDLEAAKLKRDAEKGAAKRGPTEEFMNPHQDRYESEQDEYDQTPYRYTTSRRRGGFGNTGQYDSSQYSQYSETGGFGTTGQYSETGGTSEFGQQPFVRTTRPDEVKDYDNL